MLNRLILSIVFSSSLWILTQSGDEFEDYRCKCVCPSLGVLQDPRVNDTGRRIYIDVVSPDNCTCEDVVFRATTTPKDIQERFCPRCVCSYEVRNTTTMKVVVIIIMVAITLLFIYMSFLLCLDPLMNPNSKSTTAPISSSTTRTLTCYEKQINEGVQLDNPTQVCLFSEPETTNLQSNGNRSSTVLNLVTYEQTKWRKQVQQQRQSVYNKHEILN